MVRNQRLYYQNQAIATAEMHLTALIELDVTYTELFATLEEERPQKSLRAGSQMEEVAYKNYQMIVCETKVINLHLSHSREAHMEQDETQ